MRSFSPHLALLFLSLLACEQPLDEGPNLVDHNGELDQVALVASIEAEAQRIFPPSPPPPPLSACTARDRVHSDIATWTHLADAFANALPGDTLYLCPGKHDAPLTRGGGWPLTLVGLTGNPEDVVIDSHGQGAIFYTQLSGAELTLRNLLMTTHVDEQVIADPEKDVVDIDNCIIEDTGGLNLRTARWARISRTIFRESSSFIGTTGFSISGVTRVLPPTRVLIEGCTFEKLFGGASGVGVDLNLDNERGVFALIRDSLFQDIHPHGGAALHISGDRITAKVIDTAFLRNRAVLGTDYGAAVFIATGFRSYGMDVTLERVTIADNLSDGASAIKTMLGAYYGPQPQIRIIDSEILRNRNVFVDAPVVDIAPYFLTTLDNVDFGTGPTNNYPADINFCPQTDFGAGTTYFLDYAALPTSVIPCP